MNAERLYGALINLLQEFEQLKLLDLLAQLETALNQSVSTSNPDTNKAFRAKYEELFNALQNSPTNNARPTQKSLYEEIGASKIVGVGLRNRLQDIFSTNVVTQAEFMSEFKKIRTRVIEFHKNISALRSELEKVGVKIDKVESGMFEIGIILPSAPSKDLSTLVKQLKDIEFVMQTVQEAAGAPASSPNVRMIGSSNWEIFLQVAGPAAGGLALCLERIVNMYKSYLEIKALKKSLDGQSIPKEAIEPLERHLETRLEEEFKKESEAIIKRLYSGQNEPRRNELINMMAIALKRLAKMVDHGGTIDVAGELTNEPSAEPATNSGSPEDRAKFEEKRRLFGIAAVVREHGNAIGTLEDRSKPQLALPDIQQPNENEGSKV